MDSVAFTIFGIPVAWYGILISIGVLLGLLYAVREGKKEGIDEDTMLDFAIRAMIVSIVMARAYYVIFEWNSFSSFKEMINIRTGGLAIHGAIIGGVLTAYFFCKKRKIDFWTLADISSPALLIGQIIGRWGNYLNKEAHGGPTNLPWGIMVDGIKVHPTFLYESLLNTFILIFILSYKKKKKFQGELFLLYIGLYSLIRFFIEGLRTDSLMLGPFRVAQIISIIGMSLSIYLINKKRKNK